LNPSSFEHLFSFIESIDFLNSSKGKTIMREILSSRELKEKTAQEKVYVRLAK
jgi:hypothetical protein